MEIFEPLPWPLKSKFNQEISLSVQEKLVYLWTASHKFAKSSPLISHGLRQAHAPMICKLDKSYTYIFYHSRSFIKLSEQYNIELPPYVSNRICNNCSAILIPSVNCLVRIRGRTRRSKANKQKSDRLTCNLKNEFTVNCNNCHTLSCTRIGCERKSSLQSTSKKIDIVLTNPSTPPKTPKKFSFLESSIRRASAPAPLSITAAPTLGGSQGGSMEGDFIPLTPMVATTSTSTTTSRNITYNPMRRGSFATKISSSSGRGEYTMAATNHTTSTTTTINTRPSPSPSGNKVDLLEIEKANKKQKKRSRTEALTQISPPSSSVTNNNSSSNYNNNKKRNSASNSSYGSISDNSAPFSAAYNLPRNNTASSFPTSTALSTRTASLSSLGALHAILKNKI